MGVGETTKDRLFTLRGRQLRGRLCAGAGGRIGEDETHGAMTPDKAASWSPTCASGRSVA